MRGFFTDPENIRDSQIILKEDAMHIKKVLRMEIGDGINVFDGTGKEYAAEIERIEPDRVMCKIVSESYSNTEPDIKVTLYQGIPKSDKMEWIIQKCVELGVYEIVPVIMDRCVMKLEKDSPKIKRWNKISREAVKQCTRGMIPAVSEPISFKDAVERLEQKDLSVMPYEALGHEGEKGLKELLKENKNAKEIGIIVGPEGGFSEREADLAKKEGINMVGLGRRILRTETVGGTLLSVIMYENNEF